jgi:hypothetical protein
MSPRTREPQLRWAVQVTDPVCHEIDEATSETVPPGRYTLHEFDGGIYRLSREGGPRFILSRREVGAYIKERRLTPLDGAWP